MCLQDVCQRVYFIGNGVVQGGTLTTATLSRAQCQINSQHRGLDFKHRERYLLISFLPSQLSSTRTQTKPYPRRSIALRTQ